MRNDTILVLVSPAEPAEAQLAMLSKSARGREHYRGKFGGGI